MPFDTSLVLKQLSLKALLLVARGMLNLEISTQKFFHHGGMEKRFLMFSFSRI